MLTNFNQETMILNTYRKNITIQKCIAEQQCSNRQLMLPASGKQLYFYYRGAIECRANKSKALINILLDSL